MLAQITPSPNWGGKHAASSSSSSSSSMRSGGRLFVGNGRARGGGAFGGARKKPSSSSSSSPLPLTVPRALTPQQEEPYLKLGVAPGASPEAVKRAYKRMAKMFHPDVCDEPDAALRFNDIKLAYETIASERGTLANVGSEEWRGKWQEQLRQMRKVEQGQATVNVRRRRVVRMTPAAVAAAAAAEARAAEASALSEERQEQEEEDEGATTEDDDVDDEEEVVHDEAASSASGGEGDGAMMDEEELAWQRDQEMKWTVRSQLSALKDRTRRRRQVTPPQKNKFVEPFGDGVSSMNPTAHDDEWNHTVQ